GRRAPGMLARGKHAHREPGVTQGEPHELLARIAAGAQHRDARELARVVGGGGGGGGLGRHHCANPVRPARPSRWRLKRCAEPWSLITTSTVSSPATEPTRRSNDNMSIARATPLAWPGGVRTSAKFWATRTSLTNARRSRSWRSRSRVSVGCAGR